MKQKWLSFGDDFSIKDETGREVFYVDGKVLTIRETLEIRDASGGVVAVIKKRILSWGATYDVTVGGETLATVSKKIFTLFKCRFSVDVPGPDDLEAAGDFIDKEYSFSRHGQEVAWVSKRWFHWTDTYGIDVRDDADALVVIASAVVIDLCCHDEQGHH